MMSENQGPVSSRELPLQALPTPYKAPPPIYYPQAPPAWTPRPRKPSVDWLPLIPNYHRYLYAKLCLTAVAGALAVAVVVLAKSFSDHLSPYRNPDAVLHSDTITYGSAALAIIWSLFEFMVTFLFTPHDAPLRGIHPGGHVLFHLTIWILALYSMIENVHYLKARGRRRDNLFLPNTPRRAKDEIAALQKALLGTLVALVAVEILLFCRACWETLKINSGKRAAPTIQLGTVATQQAGSQPAATPGTQAGPHGSPSAGGFARAGPYWPLAGDDSAPAAGRGDFAPKQHDSRLTANAGQ